MGLLRRADPAGYEDFVAGRYREIVRFGALLTGDARLGEDLAQEGLIAAYRSWHRLGEPDGRPEAYVRRVMVRAAMRARRRRWRGEVPTGQLPDASGRRGRHQGHPVHRRFRRQGHPGPAADDDLASFTNSGTADKVPDVLAPGESILSLRDTGSSIDVAYPAARSGTTLFRGSGTSQAAAVTSAAVALLLQAKPALTPTR